MSFAANMQKWADKTGQRLDAVIRDACMHLSTAITMRTPVGDATYWTMPAPPGYVGGRARNNWMASINTPDNTTLTTTDASGIASIRRAGGVVHQAPGNVFYLVNSLPYIGRLENGHSKQAPHGMVKLATMEFNAQLRKAAK